MLRVWGGSSCRLLPRIIAHWELRTTISDAGGRLESPSIEFGEDSDSILVENLLASVSQHQREKNAEQVKNRMRARIMNGYWCFQAPIGYKYQRVSGHGNMLVRDEPVASVIQEALEGFASEHLQTQTEVRRFLEAQPDYPKRNEKGEVHPQRVIELLTRSVYAGMIHAENWGIPMRQGQHKGLISLDTYDRIQDRLKRTAKAPARKDLNADFPLRGAVMCSDCGRPLTACWSQGKNKKYAYYLCPTKGCVSYRKSIPRAEIEGAFTELLENTIPSQPIFNTAKDVFRNLWEQRSKQVASIKTTLKKESLKLEKQIGDLLDRIVDASTPSVIHAYERRIASLEVKKTAIGEKLANTGKPIASFQEMFEHSLDYLSNPLELWHSDKLEDRRVVLKLTFANRLSYCRKEGFRTPELSRPFKALGDIHEDKSFMAHPDGESLNTLFDELADWNYQLQRIDKKPDKQKAA